MSSDWNALAEIDPLWAILSDPEKRGGKWDPLKFFITGAREAERVLAMCKSQGVSVSYGKLLDFGCGVGRMTRAFSGFFQSCVGIDISQNMVSLARKFNADQPRCEFVASDAAVLPFADKSFDFVFSVIVLQHLATRSAILRYIAEFIRIAKDNAVIVFQLPDEIPLRRRIQGRRRVWFLLAAIGVPRAWLFKKLGLAPIKMNGIPKQEVLKFIRRQDARVQAVETYDPSEVQYQSYYYFVIKSHDSARARPKDANVAGTLANEKGQTDANRH
jgi:ubiquinone/menaquinone biosynthesis C-methylase UbiE